VLADAKGDTAVVAALHMSFYVSFAFEASVDLLQRESFSGYLARIRVLSLALHSRLHSILNGDIIAWLLVRACTLASGLLAHMSCSPEEKALCAHARHSSQFFFAFPSVRIFANYFRPADLGL
jgi:hypothetical protein